MPVLGEPDFESAVRKVMRDSDVSRDSAEKIVGAAEAKQRAGKAKSNFIKAKLILGGLKSAQKDGRPGTPEEFKELEEKIEESGSARDPAAVTAEILRDQGK